MKKSARCKNREAGEEIMGVIVELARTKIELAKAKARVAELEKQFVPPPPPQSLGEIGIAELSSLLFNAFGISPNLGSSSKELTSVEEYKRFLNWYHDTHPYTLDEYDCNVFAWEMTGWALKWMDNKYPWGYIWAFSSDPEYLFPSHGFCFILNHEKKIYFSDELGVAAPRDDFEPYYPVTSSLVIVN